MVARVEISLLGPVSVTTSTGTVRVDSRPQRTVLACLALNPNRTVSAASLVDALWPDAAPANSMSNLHSYVSKLRRIVGAASIAHEHGGYRLDVDPDAVDALRAECLARAAEQLDGAQRAVVLAEALALWQGQPLADLADAGTLASERVRLAALRQDLMRARMAALIEAGQAATALPDLRQAAVSDPYDESLAELLARALSETGRVAEALRAIADFRQRLRADTGLDTGAALTRLEQRLLRTDPVVDVGPEPATASWPRYATPVHGRADLLAQVEATLTSQSVVSLIGTGGVGKTRLACAIAERRHGAGQQVHFVALAELSPGDDLAARLSAALGLRVGAAHDARSAVHERIGRGGQLLVLDNCEHVLDGVRSLVDYLSTQRTDLAVLITSRSRLGLASEHVVRVPPFAEASREGRQLFLEAARRVNPAFSPGADDEDAIGDVMRRVGGLPLAIELAAGRMATMSPGELADRVGDLDLLASGRPNPRQRSLRDSLEWSYGLLPQPARRLLRTLSVFPGGVDLPTVERLAPELDLRGGGAPELLTLVEASLVDARPATPTRYTMLEPVRAFADECLGDAGERAGARAARAAWAERAATDIQRELRGPNEADADRRLRSEVANLRAAHRAALDDGTLDAAVAISGALYRPATARDLPEVWSWALDLAVHPELPLHPRSADAYGAAASAAWLTGDLLGAQQLASAGLARDPGSVACLQALASVNLFLGDPAAAYQLWLAASRDDGAYLPQAALAAVYQGDDALSRRSLADADAWAADVGSPTEIALCHYAWGELLGPDRAAVRHYEAAIALASDVGATFVASISRVGLAATLAANGAYRRAADQFDLVIRYWRDTGNWTQQWTTLRNVADLFDAHDRRAIADLIRGAAATNPSAASVALDGRQAPDEPVHHTRAPATGASIVASALAQLAELRVA